MTPEPRVTSVSAGRCRGQSGGDVRGDDTVTFVLDSCSDVRTVTDLSVRSQPHK